METVQQHGNIFSILLYGTRNNKANSFYLGGLYPEGLITGIIFLFTGRWAYNRVDYKCVCVGGGAYKAAVYGIVCAQRYSKFLFGKLV